MSKPFLGSCSQLGIPPLSGAFPSWAFRTLSAQPKRETFDRRRDGEALIKMPLDLPPVEQHRASNFLVGQIAPAHPVLDRPGSSVQPERDFLLADISVLVRLAPNLGLIHQHRLSPFPFCSPTPCGGIPGKNVRMPVDQPDLSQPFASLRSHRSRKRNLSHNKKEGRSMFDRPSGRFRFRAALKQPLRHHLWLGRQPRSVWAAQPAADRCRTTPWPLLGPRREGNRSAIP